ncbi:MAG: NifB/NifX family molybdenum-iron cluster-binding protein [Ignavibacterium sp.]|uniref:NifB/NifX family molybdenum-iron cluster-binding protein n=1 Tax=Ignavibacterium sp. TaxID=2651167 RepID=UPI00404B144B
MNQKFKVAFATNDGVNIFSHFGRAKYFEVFEIEDKKVLSRERRDKPDFHSAAHHDHSHHNQQEHHQRHNIILSLVEDCDFVVAAGMGYGMYEFLVSKGKQPIISSVKSLDEALSLLLEEKLENHTEKIH